MAFRNIMIENPAHIHLKNKQLIIKNESEHSIALEDISTLLLESKSSSITTAALSELGKNGSTVFVCDDKHLPCAVLIPYSQHSRELASIKAQLNLSEPLKKRIWQSIVISKIKNQAECLRLIKKKAKAEDIDCLSSRVKSGDSDNIEALAAQKYFPALFGEKFTREDENIYNSALNYGYAIIRGCVARNIASYGFIPALGLHHKSELNAFNLADDLMEPFRPLIDLLVAACLDESIGELSPPIKRLLFNSLNLDILSGKQHHSVSYSIERLVQSLSKSFENKKDCLCLPELIELKQHSYE